MGEWTTPWWAGEGVLLVGWAFRRDGFGACTRLSSEEVERLVASEGRWALAALWGQFILVWADPDGHIRLLRSPVDGPPIYHNVGERGACAFTDLALARSLGFALSGPDPMAVDAALRFPFLRAARTELAGVREILPGEIAELGDGHRQPGSWSPWDYAVRPPRRIAREDLRTMVQAVTGAWSGRFGRVQLELSGGLDSSIVAMCLAGRRAAWRAITLATREPDGDERPYARAVTERAGVELIERWRPPPGDLFAPPARLRVRPGGFGLLGPSDALFLEAAREFGADAIFTGAGGDNIFGYITSAGPVLDALRFAGPLAAWRAAGDLARLTRDNRWKAIFYAARRMLRTPAPWPVEHSLLSDRYADAMPAHPWTEGADRVPAGQRTYGLALLLMQSFVNAYDRALALPKIAPLLSQPLVELGLGVPSWQWSEGGKDRALARAAFADAVPPEVLARRSKGRILSVFLPVFARERAALRPFLLDGWLAGAGILDSDAVAAMLSPGEGDPLSIMRVLEVVDIERWARSVA
ncbi:MAG TPA: asparagine synthase-related protein [Sphingopyxis sp.]|nr:asparagine synthase-related protein [Sphingopyxis sp.]HWV59613.1 asparagine synthase-related protein [Sphingopyxis sp.]